MKEVCTRIIEAGLIIAIFYLCIATFTVSGCCTAKGGLKLVEGVCDDIGWTAESLNKNIQTQP